MASGPAESGYTSVTETGALLYGILQKDTTVATGVGTIIGVTRGGLSFNPGTEWRNIGYDGQITPTKLLDRRVREVPVFTGTLIEITNANLLEVLEAGGATPTTLDTNGTGLASGDYLTNLSLLYRRADESGWAGFNFPDAFCTQWELAGQGSDGEAEVAFTFEARLVQGATPDETARAWAPLEI